MESSMTARMVTWMLAVAMLVIACGYVLAYGLSLGFVFVVTLLVVLGLRQFSRQRRG
jgi:1,4-dihydroxy-2-naphthoate octaprenyltransferase